MEETIDERLDRLLRDFRKLVLPNKRNQGRIILDGKEIRAWLTEEPTFKKPIAKRLSDDSYHGNPSDEDLTEPTILAAKKRPTPVIRRRV